MSFYGLFISLAVYTAVVLVEKKARKSALETAVIWDLMVVGILGGVLGARAYHVVNEWNYYVSHPREIMMIWQGGLGIFGALAGGITSMYFYSKRKHFALLPYLDLIATSLPLAQAIGRVGNFINQELYGPPTNMPWKVYIRPENRIAGYEEYEYFHPLFAYEIVLNIILMVLINYKYKKNDHLVGTGYFIWLYLSGYALIRFLLEFIRLETWKIQGINIAQLLSLIIFLFSVHRLSKIGVK